MIVAWDASNIDSPEFTAWCAAHDLDPAGITRVDIAVRDDTITVHRTGDPPDQQPFTPEGGA